LPDKRRRNGSRVLNFSAICRAVPANDAFTSEVDDDISAVDHTRPIAHFTAIPAHAAPFCLAKMTADHRNGMALLVQVPRENGSEMTTSPWNDDAQRRKRHLDIDCSEFRLDVGRYGIF
jgi:hypothetical protein